MNHVPFGNINVIAKLLVRRQFVWPILSFKLLEPIALVITMYN